MSSDRELQTSLRRLFRGRNIPKLQRRPNSALPFVHTLDKLPSLLLDTTVYIDQLQGRLPDAINLESGRISVWHSTVTESELVAVTGILDPNHPDTANAIRSVSQTIERRMSHRVINPDRTIWREAGMLTGTLAQIQQYGKNEHRKALNDALIFLSAAKHGLTVLTRNIGDFDLLQQIAPQGKVVFYERNDRKKAH